MLVPALPVLAAVFEAPPGAVQLVLTLFLAGIAAGLLVYGPLSDRFGRRPVLLAGLALFLAGTVLCGFARSLPMLITGRTFEALGGCAGMVLGRAIVRDIYDRERSASALATIMMVMSLAPSLAPAIGAYLAQWGGWRADFVLLGMIGAAVMILMPMAGYILGNAGVVRLSVLLGSARLFISGLALSLASGVMLAVWCLGDLTPWALFVPMAISSIGNGMSQPPGIAAGLSVYPRIAGAASGLLGFMQMALAALGTLLLGLLPRDSVVAMVAVVGASLALALVCGLFTLRAPAEGLRPAAASGSSRKIVKGS